MDHVLQEAGSMGKYLDTDESALPDLCMLMSYTVLLWIYTTPEGQRLNQSSGKLTKARA